MRRENASRGEPAVKRGLQEGESRGGGGLGR